MDEIIDADHRIVAMHRRAADANALVLLNFSDCDECFNVPEDVDWKVAIGPALLNRHTAVVPRWGCTVLSPARKSAFARFSCDNVASDISVAS